MQNFGSECEISLNFDSLAAAMPWIKGRKDLISFMSTCSDLYTAGISILLGLHHRITPQNLHSFYRFLVAKAPASFTALRSLNMSSLYASELDQDKVAVLVDILHRGQNHLQHIELSYAIVRDTSLQPTLASLSALRSLVSSHNLGLGVEEQLLITQLQSPLVKINFNGCMQEMDIVILFSNFRHTLEELVIKDIFRFNSVGGLCYPKLIHLDLSGTRPLRLSMLAPAFPNLQTLEVESSGNNKYFEEVVDVDEERGNNVQFQQDYPSARWHLVSLKGDLRSLYTLGLQVEVPTVMIATNSALSEHYSLRDALVPLRPLQLSVKRQDNEVGLSYAITPDCQWDSLVRLDWTIEYFSPFSELEEFSERLVRHVHSIFYT